MASTRISSVSGCLSDMYRSSAEQWNAVLWQRSPCEAAPRSPTKASSRAAEDSDASSASYALGSNPFSKADDCWRLTAFGSMRFFMLIFMRRPVWSRVFRLPARRDPPRHAHTLTGPPLRPTSLPVQGIAFIRDRGWVGWEGRVGHHSALSSSHRAPRACQKGVGWCAGSWDNRWP